MCFKSKTTKGPNPYSFLCGYVIRRGNESVPFATCLDNDDGNGHNNLSDIISISLDGKSSFQFLDDGPHWIFHLFCQYLAEWRSAFPSSLTFNCFQSPSKICHLRTHLERRLKQQSMLRSPHPPAVPGKGLSCVQTLLQLLEYWWELHVCY